MSDSQWPPAGTLFEGAACGLLLTDPSGMILRANRTFCGWLGVDPAAIVGQRRFQDLLTMGARIFHQTHWAPLLQMQGSISEVKLDLMHRDGRTIPMMLNAVRREHGSAVFHELAAMVAEDRHRFERELISAKKRAEELLAMEQRAQHALTLAELRLRLAIDSAHLFVWDVDPVHGVRRYEPEVAALLGHAEPRAVSQEDYAARIRAEDREAEEQAFRRAVDSPAHTYRCVYRLDGVDGVCRTIHAAARGAFDAGGTLLRFVGVLQDVSELARQRRATEDRALFAEQMIGIVSHDLRNPLQAVRMSALLLNRGAVSEAQRPVIDRIDRSAQRALRLINDLLDFTVARVGSGISIARQTIALHQIVADTVAELAHAYAAARLVHLRTGDGDCIADPDRLEQLLGNLVANAIAYGAAGREIVVASRIENDTFELSVANQGTPIEPELLERMFEPMTRGDAGNAAGRSVGLGLYIVKEIVHAHGGRVWAESSAEQGTVFKASFPRR